ncbi:acylphosphatase [Kushneria aurantia]|uniref:Acylphosphatase n=1 Tax=Kushneria aurantia TaxID=504092 RepID=A0ABV6G4T7_9GAMM|nr:acylphosphatase [Kushneria aurantia]
MRYVRAIVEGVVQGVGFRWATAERARELEIEGYARNLADGRVEVGMAGEESRVTALLEWLEQGPPSACVSGVTSEELEAQSWQGFTTG